ncbi:ParE family toxin-like protein [Enterobacter pseudoroggenkampii]
MPSSLKNPDRRKFNNCILNKARKRLQLFDDKIIFDKLVIHCKQGAVYKINVGFSHRLISKDRVVWVLMTHETYNRILKGG